MNGKDIERYWSRIINTMNDGFMLISSKGRVMMVNTAFEHLTGYTADDIIGKPCTTLKCDACELLIVSGEENYWCALFDPTQEDIRRCRCHFVRKDGSYLSVLKNASVLRDEDGVPVGAVETLTDISELDRLDQKVTELSRRLEFKEGFYGIIGTSAVMQKVYGIIEKVATSDAPVIIYGESGTGKDLVANAIHRSGRRRDRPYIPFSCAALNENVLESELFGHAKGSFTGAYRHRIGRFEAADTGEIFLDEIGDIPPSIQVKLLRVLETKAFERVGDQQPISVDVRIISATNKNLEEMIKVGKFREDLFFRINTIPIHIPPLRARKEDIPLLVSHFIRHLKGKTGKKIDSLSRSAMARFMDYSWPGNVRELKSALEYGFVVTESETIETEHLPPKIANPVASGGETATLPSHGDEQEKQALIEALKRTGGNQTQAARILGVNRVTVWNRLRKYGIDVKRVMEFYAEK